MVVKVRVLIASEYQIGIPKRSVVMACEQSYHYRAGHRSYLGLSKGSRVPFERARVWKVGEHGQVGELLAFPEAY